MGNALNIPRCIPKNIFSSNRCTFSCLSLHQIGLADHSSFEIHKKNVKSFQLVVSHDKVRPVRGLPSHDPGLAKYSISSVLGVTVIPP
jgi:hypothetical protein